MTPTHFPHPGENDTMCLKSTILEKIDIKLTPSGRDCKYRMYLDGAVSHSEGKGNEKVHCHDINSLRTDGFNYWNILSGKFNTIHSGQRLKCPIVSGP